MYSALKAADVPVELHVFESGKHGFGLAPGDPVLSTWVKMCELWLKRRGWIPQ
jgi:acetyl esterase/lipase